MKALGIGVALLTGTVVAAGVALADEGHGKKDKLQAKVERAASAAVAIDQAIKAASEKVAGKVIEAELESKHDKTVWEVEVVTADSKVMEVHVDAATGAVIDVEEKKAERKRERMKERKREHKDEGRREPRS
ncbi:PepSY domain-containing protein [Nitrospira sp. Kam-Ns4a]